MRQAYPLNWRQATGLQTYAQSVEPEQEIARREGAYIYALEAPKTLKAEEVFDRLHRTDALGESRQTSVSETTNFLNFSEIPNDDERAKIEAADLTITLITQDLSEISSNFTKTVTTGCSITLT